MSTGKVSSWIGVSWLGLLACGGISERQVTEGGGAPSGDSGGHPTRGGSPAAVGGGAVATGGATMTPREPPVDSGAACFNDIDCPGSACGNEVCNWTKTAAAPIGMKAFLCNPAGTQPKGLDGWCTTDADCKCLAQGAKCRAPFCTFTRAEDGPSH